MISLAKVDAVLLPYCTARERQVLCQILDPTLSYLIRLKTRGLTPVQSDSRLEDWRSKATAMESAIAQAVIGQAQVIRLINIALLARGHVLLEGDVGVGKTTVLRAFARAAGGDFERVEGTIDLMPTDLVYHTYVNEEGQPRIDPGPLLHHGETLTTFFFNEINRARPQVQSLLLRAMAERSVSAFNKEFRFPHMTVFADRNKVEREETFELAAAARDRFMFELNMATPSDPDVRKALILDTRYHDADSLINSIPAGMLAAEQLNAVAADIQSLVQASPTMENYLLDIWQATQTPDKFSMAIDGVDMHKLMLAGCSPRGLSALTRAARVVAWLEGRDHLIPEDVHTVLPSALGHRVFFKPVYELRRSDIAPLFIEQLMQRVASP